MFYVRVTVAVTTTRTPLLDVVRVGILLDDSRVVTTARTCSRWSTTRATRTTRVLDEV